MVPTQFVNLIRIHLREACILICSQLLVKTNMLGVLDLVLVYTVGTLSIWSMITFVYLLVVFLGLLILCLLLFLGHDVALSNSFFFSSFSLSIMDWVSSTVMRVVRENLSSLSNCEVSISHLAAVIRN